jgi:pimeloyl-ACP methyl ester carboxylesterase
LLELNDTMKETPLPAVNGIWNSTEVAGHICHTYEPPQLHEHGYVVLFLHGVHMGMLHDQPRFLEQFDRHGLRVICPVTERSWWTDRICDEFDARFSAERYLLDHVVPAISAHYGVSPPKIGLLGTSMGGQGALRMAFKHPNTFPVVAAVSPAIDYYQRWDDNDETICQMYADKEAARQDTATLHIHPLNWPRNIWFCCDPTDERWVESSERLRMKLSALGIPFQSELAIQAGGHGFEYYNRMAPEAIRFLVDRLDQERLRVV